MQNRSIQNTKTFIEVRFFDYLHSRHYLLSIFSGKISGLKRQCPRFLPAF